MQKISQKLSFAVKFFKIFGYELEYFEEPQSKHLKIFKYWPILSYIVHLAVVCFLSIQTIVIISGEEYMSFREEYAGIILKISINITENVGLFCTFLRRKYEVKFWRSIHQLDDFINRFLSFKMDYSKENWHHLRRILFIITINYSLTLILSLDFSSSQKYQRYFNTVVYFVILNQLNMNKYVFYASIINNRLKILSENFHQVKDCGYKVLVVQRVYSIICKMLHKVENRYDWSITFTAFTTYMYSFYFGYILSLDLSKNSANYIHAVSLFGPQVTLWFICYHCNKIKEIVSKQKQLLVLKSVLKSEAQTQLIFSKILIGKTAHI